MTTSWRPPTAGHALRDYGGRLFIKVGAVVAATVHQVVGIRHAAVRGESHGDGEFRLAFAIRLNPEQARFLGVCKTPMFLVGKAVGACHRIFIAQAMFFIEETTARGQIGVVHTLAASAGRMMHQDSIRAFDLLFSAPASRPQRPRNAERSCGFGPDHARAMVVGIS